MYLTFNTLAPPGSVRNAIIKFFAVIALAGGLSLPASAQVVMVGDSSGSGFLFHHRGNCFVILPKHVHDPRFKGIRLSVPNDAIGSADIVYSTDDATDLSLGLVTGGIVEDCGVEWSSLPRRLDALRPGSPVTVLRGRQKSQDARGGTVGAITFEKLSVHPAPGQPADFFAGTSGATVFSGEMPVGMVTDAETAGEAWALRMDEVAGRLSRWIEGVQDGRVCDDPAVAERVAACRPDTKPEGDALPFEVVQWSQHPVGDSVDPMAMAQGKGPYIADMVGGLPLKIELLLPETLVLGRVTLRSEADGAESFMPRSVRVSVDTSDGPVRRPLNFLNRDMPPDGLLDVERRKTYARRVTIEILSTWGGGSPVRIDEIVLR